MELKNMFGLTNGTIFGEPPLYVDKSKSKRDEKKNPPASENMTNAQLK